MLYLEFEIITIALHFIIVNESYVTYENNLYNFKHINIPYNSNYRNRNFEIFNIQF